MTHEYRYRRLEFFLLCMLVLIVVSITQFSTSFSQGPNNRNVSVDTRVNITGTSPEVLFVGLENPITLNAGALKHVTCNLSIRDFNGFADIDTVSARFFAESSSYDAADDNNTHYTNSSCSAIAGEESGPFANYTCSFFVNYYALNETWNCTGLANDTIDLRGNNTNITMINQLLALNVTTLIDYGDMAMGDYSDNQTANVTNLGNRPINVTVKGYGLILDDGYSFVCAQGNLSVGLQHFAANSTADYAAKQTLTSTLQQVMNLTVPKAINATERLNTTYWELFLDTAENAFGLCNGTIIFQAEAS